MKKKKHLADLMEEDLLETIQQRINELNDNEAREHFLERLDRLKRKWDDQKNALCSPRAVPRVVYSSFSRPIGSEKTPNPLSRVT